MNDHSKLIKMSVFSRVYTKSIYFCKNGFMKTLSLKLDDDTFNEAEEITTALKLARNRYINEAVNLYNKFNRRKLLKSRLAKESRLTMADSLEVLHEFEKLADES